MTDEMELDEVIKYLRGKSRLSTNPRYKFNMR